MVELRTSDIRKHHFHMRFVSGFTRRTLLLRLLRLPVFMEGPAMCWGNCFSAPIGK